MECKRYWEKQSDKPLGLSQYQTRPETLDEAKEQRFTRSLIRQKNGYALKMDLWNLGVRRGVFNVELFETFEFVGIDISKRTCLKAKNKHHWIEAINADMKYLPFRDDAFDVILDISSCDHIPLVSVCLLIEEYSRILKPNGELLIWFNKSDPSAKLILRLLFVLRNLPFRRFYYSYLRGLPLRRFYYSFDFAPRRVKAKLNERFIIQFERHHGLIIFQTHVRLKRLVEERLYLTFLMKSYVIKAIKVS